MIRLLLITCLPVLAAVVPVAEGTHVADPGNTQGSMFDPEFFPTPKKVVRQMLAQLQLTDEDLFENTDSPQRRRELSKAVWRGKLQDLLILEPSAGNGAILDEVLWQRFNIAAAQGKKWLPMDYEHRPSDGSAPKAEVQRLMLTA